MKICRKCLGKSKSVVRQCFAIWHYLFVEVCKDLKSSGLDGYSLDLLPATKRLHMPFKSHIATAAIIAIRVCCGCSFDEVI